MNPIKISPHLSVSAQLQIDDLVGLKNAGFKSVVCNRPDGESSEQVEFAKIQEAAQALGIQIEYLPVVSGQETSAIGDAFGHLLARLPSPTLAYCRSGMRSARLWAFAEAGRIPLTEILDTAHRSGFDLTGYTEKLKQTAAGQTDSK